MEPCLKSPFTTDHLGTPRVITDQDGTVLSTHDYLAYGEELTDPEFTVHSPSGESPLRFDRMKPKQPDGCAGPPFGGYTGHERDPETGLDYMLARYYASGSGRFLQVDPGYDYDPMDPMSFNLYGYVRERPVIIIDPSGMWVSGYSKWWNPATWFTKVGDPKATAYFVTKADPKAQTTVDYFLSLVPHDKNGSVVVFRPHDPNVSYPGQRHANDARYNADVYVYNASGVHGPYLGSTATTNAAAYPNIQNGVYQAVEPS